MKYLNQSGPFWLRTLCCASLLGMAATTAVAQDDEDVQIDEQVVTGTILRGNITAVSPIQTIEGTELQNAPQLTLNDYFVTYFTPNASANTEVQTQASGGSGLRGDRGTSLDLRGLGSENTLVLINGVRTVEYAAADDDGWRSVDINGTIPTIAVRRTDVLLDGGSAIYGTDAVAGVVNLIPDYGFRGGKISFNGAADEDDYGYADYAFSAMWGGGNETTNYIVAYEKSMTNPAAIAQSNNANREGDWSDPQPGDPIYDGADTAPEHNWFAAQPGIVENTYRAYLYPETWLDPAVNVTNHPLYQQWDRNTFAAIYDPNNWAYETSYAEWAADVNTSNTRCLLDPLDPNHSYDPPGVFTSGATGDMYVSSSCGEVTERIFDWGTSAASHFVDPLCGRAEVFGREQIFVGDTRDQFVDEYVNADGEDEGLSDTDAYGCLWYDRPGRLMIENEMQNDNQVALFAFEHMFSDDIRWAAEVSWSENVAIDHREYFPDSSRSVRLIEDSGITYENVASNGATFEGIDTDGGVVSSVYVPDWIVEWDHPGVAMNADLWDQLCDDVDEYCYGPHGANPWLESSYDPANVPTGLFAGDYNAYPFDNHSKRENQANMYRFGNSLTWQINDDWSALFGGVIAKHEVKNELDDLIPERLALALKGLGGPNCGVTIDQFAADPNGFDAQKGTGNCMYWNPFMNAMHPDAETYGATNDASVQKWITGPATVDYVSDFWSLNASASGVIDSIDLGSGPLAIAVGAEYRSDELNVDFDELYERARYVDIQSGDAFADYTGKTTTVGVLVDSSLPLTDALTMQLAARAENIEAGDLSYDSLTYKAGFNFAATDDLTLRAAYGTSFRAPTVNHLYGRQGRPSSTVDLWDDPELDDFRANIGPGDYDPSEEPGNNAINGLPDDLRIRQEGVTTVLAPNPDLNPQEGTALSFGMTYDITDNLRLTLSYVDITFENAINSASVAYARSVCGTATDYFDAGELNQDLTWYQPDYNGFANESCFGLDDDGNVIKFFDSFYNVGEEGTEALDFSVDWRMMTDLGTFSLRPNGTINLKRTIQDLSTNNLVVDTVAADITGISYNGISEYRMNLPMAWEYDKHRLVVTGRWQSAIKDYDFCSDPAGCTLGRDFDGDGVDTYVDVAYGGTLVTDTSSLDDDYITADLRYSYEMSDNMNVALTMTNLLNNQPERNGTIFPADIRRVGLQFNMTFGQ